MREYMKPGRSERVADVFLSMVIAKKLQVKLVSVPKSSPLGQLKGADNLIEIYTYSYGEIPIVIQGAGAGKQVTARGVLTDILKIAEKIKVKSLLLMH